MNRYRAGLLTAALLFAGTAVAQSVQVDGLNEAPERGVARVSLINGDVSVRRGDSEDMVAAALNAPLVSADRVMTGNGSRAEIQFDSSNMIRLAAFAEVRLAGLDYNRYQIQIARGTVMFRVLRDAKAEVELSTPTVSVRPVGRGTYRVTVRDDGTTEITVRAGQADIFTPQGNERLEAGRTMLARGTPSEPEVQVMGAIHKDEWEHWNVRRDHDLERSRSYQYVSRDIYGAEDLDDHGRWVSDAEYGNVWSPYAAAGWAPYRNGRWVWIDYYGWSWVSYDSWGWAPYHYGRWFYRPAGGWCWYPGGLESRHYWSPALVAFFGFGGGHLGVGFGNIGWVPLAPQEPYYRWYGRGYYSGYRDGGYGDRSINIINNVNITNVYRNARVTNGVSIVEQDGFGRGRGGNHYRAGGEELNQASLVRGQLPVAPERESLRMSDRQVGNFQPTADTTRFASRMQAASSNRIPFEEQRRGVEQASRGAFAGGRQGVGDPVSPGSIPNPVGAGRGSVTSRSGGDDGGWRRFGEPVTSQPMNRGGNIDRGASSRSEQNAGWRQFGNGVSGGQPAAVNRGNAGQQGDAGSSGSRPNDGWRGMSGQGPAFRGSDSRGSDIQRSNPNGWLGDSATGSRMSLSEPVGAGRGSAASASRGGDGGWRRFGEPVPAPSQERSIDRGASSRSAQNSEWQQLGNGISIAQPGVVTRGAASQPGYDAVSPAQRTDEGWRGMSGQGPAFRGRDSRGADMQRSNPNGWRGESAPVQHQQMQQMQRNDAPRYQAPVESGRGNGGGGFGGRSESIRISPPIVRERSAPQGESRQSSGGGGGGGRGENSGGRTDGGRGGGGRGR